MAVKPLLALVVVVLLATDHVAAQRPIPAWPDQFTVRLLILVEQYGPEWNSSGVLYYDWKTQVS